MKINRTIGRGISILSLVADHPEGLTISDMAATLDIPKSSVFDIVHTLRMSSFLREDNKQFFIGFKASEIGSSYDNSQDLYGMTKPILVEASETLGLFVALITYTGEDLEYLFQYQPNNSIVVPKWEHSINHIHATASGKAILANLSPAKQKKIIDHIDFIRLTANTVTDREEFIKELEIVKQQGFAQDRGEYNEFLNCISVPIINRKSKIIAAITFSGLQLFNHDFSSLVDEIKAVKTKILQKLAKQTKLTP